MRAAKEHGSLAPPKHILNAPTKLMKQEGYGAGYDYDHNAAEAFSGQNYFPDGMARQQFYEPDGRGFRRDGAAAVLRSRRPRLRGRGEEAPGALGQVRAKRGDA